MEPETGYGQFKCARCGRVGERGIPPEQAEAELKHYFGEVPLSERVEVCDDCWAEIRPEANPDHYSLYRRLQRVGALVKWRN